MEKQRGKNAEAGKGERQPAGADPEQQGKQGTNKALLISLGLAVVLVGAYHGTNMVRDSQPQSSAYTYPGAPPDTVIISGSTNGTLLNDHRVQQPVEVHAGDVLKVGKTVLELRR